MRTFRLYPEEARWWSFNDYGAVLDVMHRIKPARVLEFGPGSSTLALIEGGAEKIDCCEDDPKWANVYADRLERVWPTIVTIRPFVQSDPLAIPALDGIWFDLALIDGPYQTPNREPAIRYALDRSEYVLVCTEDDGRKHNSFLRPVIERQAAGRRVEYMETGPLAGGFALVHPG